MEHQVHKLKILPEYYKDILLGRKNFEIRKNDRSFHVGDMLILKEWDGKYTGNQLERWIGYIHYGNGDYGLLSGYCVLGLCKNPPRAPDYKLLFKY